MRRKPLILVSLLLAAFVINLDTTIVNVALPTLVRQLHASNTQLQWVVDAYNLVFAALLLASGSMSDRVGRKGMLLAGLTLFGLASVAGGLTTTPGALIVARAFMGLGAAAVFPATLSLISNVFTERAERARAIGLWGATAGVAVALGPIVGGWLLSRFSWSSIFFAMAPVAAVATALVWRFVPTSRDPEAPRTDRPGVVLSASAMALLIFTIIEAPNRGWDSVLTLAGFALAALLIGAFAIAERRSRAPMLDISLFANPRFSAASAAVTIAFFNLFGFIFLITQYFQFFKAYTPLSAGVHLLPVAISIGVASVLGTRLAVRIGTKLIVVTGLLATTGFYLWVSTVSVRTSYATIAAQMVIYGTGIGLTSAPATEAIMGVVPKTKAGVGSAVNDTTRPARRNARRRDHRQRLRLAAQAGSRRHSRRGCPHRWRTPPISRSAPLSLSRVTWLMPGTRQSPRPSAPPPQARSSTASASPVWSPPAWPPPAPRWPPPSCPLTRPRSRPSTRLSP